ncbi:MAG: methionyl-tRNA formyltransferase [Geminicoccaceae bacterium]|nr:methionyl-tRNA formyltransferase [Geminicoccaceae bacterium]
MLRIAFMGTSAFAVPALDALARSKVEVVAVYTQPPRRAGRGKKHRPSPVHEAAIRHGLPVETPLSFRDEDALRTFAGLGLDVAVVASYGLLLPRAVLDAPRLGCINIHASTLPRWRGAAPIQRAILAGDRETGVDLFQMEEGLDTGPVLLRRKLLICEDDTSQSLHDRLAELGASMIPDLVEGLESGSLRPVQQPSEGAIYARKLVKEEADIDFSRPAVEIERMIRAFDPWPGAWCRFNEQRLRIHKARVIDGKGSPGEVIALPLTIACGEGALEILEIQREGRRSMTADELQRGFAIPPESRVG